MTILRVIPRDLFNDANLLKCVGKLALLAEDGLLPLHIEYDNKPFDIQMNPDDGSTYIRNIEFFTKTGSPIHLTRPLNSRNPWPLYAETGDSDAVSVFTDDGTLTPEFEHLLGQESDR